MPINNSPGKSSLREELPPIVNSSMNMTLDNQIEVGSIISSHRGENINPDYRRTQQSLLGRETPHLYEDAGESSGANHTHPNTFPNEVIQQMHHLPLHETISDQYHQEDLNQGNPGGDQQPILVDPTDLTQANSASMLIHETSQLLEKINFLNQSATSLATGTDREPDGESKQCQAQVEATRPSEETARPPKQKSKRSKEE